MPFEKKKDMTAYIKPIVVSGNEAPTISVFCHIALVWTLFIDGLLNEFEGYEHKVEDNENSPTLLEL